MLGKVSKLPMSPEQVFFIYSHLKSCIWLLLVATTLAVKSTLCERSFSKMKLVKIFPRNSMTNGRLGNTELFSIWRYELKNRFRWFRWRIDSRHVIEELSYIEVMMIQSCNVDCAGICVRIILLIVYLSESF